MNIVNKAADSKKLEKPLISNLEVGSGRVMIVDDEENPRLILRRILEMEGHEVIECESGQQALDAIAKDPPDVVLLDVVMQGINGHEVCRKLKGNPETAAIPVLIISGFNRREDRLQGIEAGANDFIGKPVDFKDVSLRVRNCLYAKRLHDQTRLAYQKLKELEEMRDSLTHMVIHDIRSPLTGLMGYLELMQSMAGSELTSDSQEILATSRKLAEIIMNMIQSMLDVTLMENSAMPLQIDKTALPTLIDEVLDMLMPKLSNFNVRRPKNEQKFAAYCDAEVVKRILANLILNASHFSPPKTTISIAIEKTASEIMIKVSDQGPGIDKEHKGKIFKKFGVVDGISKKKTRSAGLGLAFCKLAVEAHGGNIGVDSEKGSGATFWFTLPLKSPKFAS